MIEFDPTTKDDYQNDTYQNENWNRGEQSIKSKFF